MTEKNLAQIIKIAIQREEEACAFYHHLLTKVTDKATQETLLFLAEEEKKHKAFLVNYSQGGQPTIGLQMSEVIDYHIAQHLEKPDLAKNIESAEAFLIAAHRELNSHNFYQALAKIQPPGEMQDMLNKMANEELKHKEKVEYLYSNTAFAQTEGG